MTHFVTLIVVPKATMESGERIVNEYINEKMGPYSEEFEVEPCVTTKKKKAEKEINEYIKGIKDKKKKSFYNNIDWAGKVEQYYGGGIDKEGNVTSTFNPKSFWDWFVIGGRWDGILTENIQKSENGFNFNEKHHTLSNNCIKVSALLHTLRLRLQKNKGLEIARKDILMSLKEPLAGVGFYDILRKEKSLNEKQQDKIHKEITKRFADYIRGFDFENKALVSKIMDKKGKYHAGKDFGWWGFSKDIKSKEKWIKEYIKVLEEAQGDYIVNLDCHV